MSKTIISTFASRQEFMAFSKNNNPGLIVLKLGAIWCGPCKKIKHVVDAFFLSSPDEVICCDIDVDDSFDLYAFLKNKKMVNGVPAILCYKRGNESFIPTNSVSGTDAKQLDAFFKRCNQHLQSVAHIK